MSRPLPPDDSLSRLLTPPPPPPPSVGVLTSLLRPLATGLSGLTSLIRLMALEFLLLMLRAGTGYTD